MSRLLLPALLLVSLTLPAATPPPSVDRDVAEWAIRLGGAVVVEGGHERIRRLDRLPADDFRVEELNLVGCNIDPPDLYRLSPLLALKRIHLPGPMWNPRAGANKDYSADLGYFATLPKLEELTFSYTFLATIKFHDEGLAMLAPPPTLSSVYACAGPR
ncbi:MAG: hypothetical protein R2748_09190 [Bryobacterales bacterium]